MFNHKRSQPGEGGLADVGRASTEDSMDLQMFHHKSLTKEKLFRTRRTDDHR